MPETSRQKPSSFSNISASTLMNPINGVSDLLDLLRATKRTPQMIVLDVTEHERIRDYELLHHILAAYRSEGLRFALRRCWRGTLDAQAPGLRSANEYLKLGRNLTMTSAKPA